MSADPAASPTTQASGSALAVLRQRNVWPYFTGNLLSNCGTWFQNIAQALLVYRLTHSTLLVGVVNFAQFVGVFILAPWAGGAADTFDRRRLIIVTQCASIAITATLAILSATGLATPPVVIALALLLGLATAFYIPALQALVPSLVERGDLSTAIALNSVTFNLARAVGPVAGALVVARFGISVAFAVNACSYGALILGLLLVHPRPQAARPTSRPKLRESLVLVRDDAKLGVLLTVVAAVSLTADPINTLTPGFAVRVFHHSDTLTGYLVGAFGIGSVVAAFWLGGRRGDPYRRMPVTTFVLGAFMALFGLSRSLPLAVPALLIAGFGFLASTTTATTLLQLEVDDSQRGRIMALWSVAFLGIRPIGSLVDGAVATAFGLHTAAVVMAAPALLASGGLALLLRRWRRRDTAIAGAGADGAVSRT